MDRLENTKERMAQRRNQEQAKDRARLLRSREELLREVGNGLQRIFDGSSRTETEHAPLEPSRGGNLAGAKGRVGIKIPNNKVMNK